MLFIERRLIMMAGPEHDNTVIEARDFAKSLGQLGEGVQEGLVGKSDPEVANLLQARKVTEKAENNMLFGQRSTEGAVLQTALHKLGHGQLVGHIDGWPGPNTRAGLDAYKNEGEEDATAIKRMITELNSATAGEVDEPEASTHAPQPEPRPTVASESAAFGVTNVDPETGRFTFADSADSDFLTQGDFDAAFAQSSDTPVQPQPTSAPIPNARPTGDRYNIDPIRGEIRLPKGSVRKA